MAEESTLRQAINKITDWPAASAATTPVPRAQSAGAPGTTVALANDVAALPPDPFVAELATLQASNAELASQIAGMTTPTTTAETVTDPVTGAVLVEPSATLGYSEYYAENPEALEVDYIKHDYTDVGEDGTWASGVNPWGYRNDYNQYVLDNDKLWADYYKASGDTDITYDQYWGGNQEALDYSSYKGSGTDLASNWSNPETNPWRYRNEYNAYVAGGTPDASGAVVAPAPTKAPTNPGPRASWQKSAQYWKDLDAYTKAQT